MKALTWAIAACLTLGAAGSDPVSAAPPPENFSARRVNGPRPSLIVQITLDQGRADLLERYKPALTGGLARLMREGWYFPNGKVAHAVTVSFPGHATLATGMHPNRHGLTANEWWMQKDGKWASTDVTANAKYRLVGLPERQGRSPHHLQSATLADWIKHADPRAKTVALATGGGVSVAYGGKAPTALYWYDRQDGSFVTSTYYHSELHPWIARFNRDGIRAFSGPAWTLAVSRQYHSLANADAAPHERGGKNNSFPHEYRTEKLRAAPPHQSYGSWFGETPMKDEALFALAEQAIEAEQLGTRGVTDYLAVLPDATDTVGHLYGPGSLEQLDTVVRIDRALGAFLDYLDRRLGAGRYIIALSADHGVIDPPETRGDRRVTAADIDALLDKVETLASSHRGSRQALITSLKATLKRAEFIADAYSEADLASEPRDAYAAQYKLSSSPGRTTDFPLWTSKERDHHPARYGIVVRFKEGRVFDFATGIHGSPYSSDTSVPVIFFGGAIPAFRDEREIRTVDVAPTLGRLAGVAAPTRLDGRVIERPSSLGK